MLEKIARALAEEIDAEELPRLRAYGWAEGYYSCICKSCGFVHVAAKGAWNCRSCADNLARRDERANSSQNPSLELAAVICERLAEESKGSDKPPEFWLLTAANRIRDLR